MKNFKAHLIKKLKRHLKHEFQTKYKQFKQFQKI